MLITFLKYWENPGELGNIPVLNSKFFRVDKGTEISLFISLSIFTGMLLCPFALFKLKVFNIFRTLSGVRAYSRK